MTITRRILEVLTVAAFAVGLLSSGARAAHKTPDDRFVRTANYHLHAGTDIRPSDYPTLAKYDLLVFPVEAQIYNRVMFPELRRLNPDIIILAYVTSKSWNNVYWNDALHQKMRAGIKDEWWLLDPQGNHVSVWPGTWVISGVSPWNDYLPRFVKDEVMSTGLWDGVFYDEFSSNASWMNGGNIDSHRDGKKDDPALLDVAWKRGMLNMLKLTRELLGPEAVIVTNGDSTYDLQTYVNGRMFESFPTPWEAGGTWQGVMANYLGLHEKVGYAPVFIINSNTGDSGQNADYKKVRFGLASTLLGDGYFSFDFGESDHGALWHYDEMEVRLGRPLAGAVNLSTPGDTKLRTGVWRRDFQNGIALVNSGATNKTVSFTEEFEKLRGSQDPSVNDGSLVTSVTIPPSDGLILLRRVQHVTDAAFPNGAYVRSFDPAGVKVRNGFFAYEAPYDGAVTVTVTDLNDDGADERVVAGKTEVTVYGAGGGKLASFAPYGAAHKAGMSLAVGDLDGDGKAEIVTGAGNGSAPLVRVFKADGTPTGAAFNAYNVSFRGGVNVAVADLYGTGQMQIITGAGPGGGPHVRVYSRTGRLLNNGFFPYDARFRGGVNVAAGDLDGDGKAEIITGAGVGGGPHVRIFSAAGRSWGKGFFAGDASSRGGVRVAVTDIDGNGKKDIVTFSTDVFQLSTVR